MKTAMVIAMCALAIGTSAHADQRQSEPTMEMVLSADRACRVQAETYKTVGSMRPIHNADTKARKLAEWNKSKGQHVPASDVKPVLIDAAEKSVAFKTEALLDACDASRQYLIHVLTLYQSQRISKGGLHGEYAALLDAEIARMKRWWDNDWPVLMTGLGGRTE